MVAHEKFWIILLQLCFKIQSLLSHLAGWLIGLMSFLVIHFGPNTQLFHWIVGAIFLDLIFGAWSSLKRKKFHISFALVSTAIKLAIYGVVFYMPLAIDAIIPTDLSMITITTCVLLVSAEFWSILAHVLIIQPSFIGIKWVQRLLSVEISKKLDMNVEEFNKSYFKNKENEN